jgi:hypothetical protein
MVYELKNGDEIIVETAQGNYLVKIIKNKIDGKIKLLNGKTETLDETELYILIDVIGLQ